MVCNGTLVWPDANPAGISVESLTIGPAGVLRFNGPWDTFQLGLAPYPPNLPGPPTMNIIQGGQVYSPGNTLRYGKYVYSVLNISGAGSLYNGFALYASTAGGSVNITDGGKAEADYVVLGGSASSTSTVSGAGSSLRQTNTSAAAYLVVGADTGNNTLIISNQANVDVAASFYAGITYAGSIGHLIVDNATMTNKQLFVIGENGGWNGSSSMIIRNGGRVYCAGISTIGRSRWGAHVPPIVGAVTVDGAGSVWTNLSNLIVGEYGDAALVITNGGRVYCAGLGGVGQYPGAHGRVDVVGNGSRWDVAGSYVGLGDQGNTTGCSMLVSEGATVAAAGQFFIADGCTLELAGGTVQSGATPWFRLYGAATVFKGWGTVVGNVNNAGVFLPGGSNATGALTFSNDFTFASTSTSTFDFVSGAYDQAVVKGNFTAGGELNLAFIGRPVGGRYVIINVAGTKSGSFSKTNWLGTVRNGTRAGFEGNNYVVNVPIAGTVMSIR